MENPPPNSATSEIAILAAGCFWGVEKIIREQSGVLNTQVGYTGGALENPKYIHVKTGTTDHAEAIQIEFDPARLSYQSLLKLFFRLHDPTQLNRQGNVIGTQYRSAIFYRSEAQRETATMVKATVEASGQWKNPIQTQIVPAQKFWDAEEEHQDYLLKNPGGYNCHWVRPE